MHRYARQRNKASPRVPTVPCPAEMAAGIQGPTGRSGRTARMARSCLRPRSSCLAARRTRGGLRRMPSAIRSPSCFSMRSVAHRLDSRSTSRWCEQQEQKTSYEDRAQHQRCAEKPEHHQFKAHEVRFGVSAVVQCCLITFRILRDRGGTPSYLSCSQQLRHTFHSAETILSHN